MSYPFEGSTEEPTYQTATDIEAEADHEVDEVDNVDDQPEDEGSEPRPTSSKPARRKAPRGGARLAPAQVRRVLSQAALIEEQGDLTRSMLAAILGTSTSTEDLVVATLGSPKVGDIIADILAISAEEDQFQPVMLAHTLLSERDNARRVWALLTALGKVSGGIPAKDIQAAAAVATAAKSLTTDNRYGLERVANLLG